MFVPDNTYIGYSKTGSEQPFKCVSRTPSTADFKHGNKIYTSMSLQSISGAEMCYLLVDCVMYELWCYNYDTAP